MATPGRTTISRVWCAAASMTCRGASSEAAGAESRRGSASRCWTTEPNTTAAAARAGGADDHPSRDKGGVMAGKSLKGTRSFENLKEAFAGESQANRRYLYFARGAGIQGVPGNAGPLQDTPG